MVETQVVFRVCLLSGEATDWLLPTTNITFHDVLDVLSRVTPGDDELRSFRYEDSEGDLITVRCDDELTCLMAAVCGDLGGEVVTRVVKVWPGDHSPAPPLSLTTTTSSSPPDTDHLHTQPTLEGLLTSGHLDYDHLDWLGLVGGGSSGHVYRARDRRSGAAVAVKVIPLEVETSDQQQIISELEILHRCQSPNIVSFFGAFFRENRIFSCMQYMDGGSLDKCCGQRLAEDLVGHLTRGVVAGLDYLWSIKIMHRDVKPSNVLVNTSGDVKLCDFGISKQLVKSIAKTYVGTNAYMAPERIQGSEYGMYSDIWSLGVTLYELASGRFPYTLSDNDPGASAPLKLIDLIQAIVVGDPPSLSPEHYTEAFCDFVRLCLQKSPRTRPQPSQLLAHQFISRITEPSNDVIAAWVVNILSSGNA